MAAAEGTALEAYIVVSLLSGVRTEEARALRWDHVVAWVDEQWRPVTEVGFDHEQVAVFVWRAERAGGDTKTPKSRRTLALPRKCVEALREHRLWQVKDRMSARPLWNDNDLVFASAVGTRIRTTMSNHTPLNCGALADEQCCLAGVPDDRDQSDAVVMSAGQYPVYGAH
jgi:integrase